MCISIGCIRSYLSVHRIEVIHCLCPDTHQLVKQLLVQCKSRKGPECVQVYVKKSAFIIYVMYITLIENTVQKKRKLRKYIFLCKVSIFYSDMLT